jgi:hypothetical protein
MALAAGAHLAGGGRLPPAVVLLVLTLLTGTAAVALTSRRLNGPALAAVLTVQQLVLHYLFAATAGLAPVGCAGAVVAHHGAASLPAGCTDLVSTAAGDPMSAMSGGSMWLAHVVATVVTTWFLASGEARLWAIADRLVDAAEAAPGRWPSRRARTARTAPLARPWVTRPTSAAGPRAPPVAGVRA